MTVKSILLSSALLLASNLTAGNLSAAPKWPTVSASVRATATVVNPIGIITESLSGGQLENELWMVRYPAPDGIQMTVQLDGELIQTIRIERTRSTSDFQTFNLISPQEQLAPSIAGITPEPGRVVITLLSTSQ